MLAQNIRLAGGYGAPGFAHREIGVVGGHQFQGAQENHPRHLLLPRRPQQVVGAARQPVQLLPRILAGQGLGGMHDGVHAADQRTRIRIAVERAPDELEPARHIRALTEADAVTLVECPGQPGGQAARARCDQHRGPVLRHTASLRGQRGTGGRMGAQKTSPVQAGPRRVMFRSGTCAPRGSSMAWTCKKWYTVSNRQLPDEIESRAPARRRFLSAFAGWTAATAFGAGIAKAFPKIKITEIETHRIMVEYEDWIAYQLNHSRTAGPTLPANRVRGAHRCRPGGPGRGRFERARRRGEALYRDQSVRLGW